MFGIRKRKNFHGEIARSNETAAWSYLQSFHPDQLFNENGRINNRGSLYISFTDRFILRTIILDRLFFKFGKQKASKHIKIFFKC